MKSILAPGVEVRCPHCGDSHTLAPSDLESTPDANRMLYFTCNYRRFYAGHTDKWGHGYETRAGHKYTGPRLPKVSAADRRPRGRTVRGHDRLRVSVWASVDGAPAGHGDAMSEDRYENRKLWPNGALHEHAPQDTCTGPYTPNMAPFDKKIEVAPSSKTESWHREVQLPINIAEPDPRYQPVILTDEASLLDAVGTAAEEITNRLNAYFGVSLALDISLPVWRLVDEIKRLRPGWPDEFGPN